MILTPQELNALTGKKRRDAQQRALIEMEIEHIVRPDGSVAVARARVDRLLGVGTNTKVAAPTEPDWDALRAATS